MSKMVIPGNLGDFCGIIVRNPVINMDYRDSSASLRISYYLMLKCNV